MRGNSCATSHNMTCYHHILTLQICMKTTFQDSQGETPDCQFELGAQKASKSGGAVYTDQLLSAMICICLYSRNGHLWA